MFSSLVALGRIEREMNDQIVLFLSPAWLNNPFAPTLRKIEVCDVGCFSKPTIGVASLFIGIEIMFSSYSFGQVLKLIKLTITVN